MKSVAWIVGLVLVSVLAIEAQQPQQQASKEPEWAFPAPSKDQPPAEDENKPIMVPGSDKTYTAKQIDDLLNPPDWFPNEHPPAPMVVTHGSGQALACGSCHLMTGEGHPESATLAGLSSDYIVEQMADFKSGQRIDPARMNAIAKAVPDADAKMAADYFSGIKPMVWYTVKETDMVPKTYVTRARARLPLPGGEMEPIGNRIIEVPQDAALAMARDPHSGFIAYAPMGSVAKGEQLATNGGGGKTVQCAICHGDGLTGMGDVPKIAGLAPSYIARQLYNFQSGASNGSSAQLMKPVVMNLTDEDILNLAAYVASQAP